MQTRETNIDNLITAYMDEEINSEQLSELRTWAFASKANEEYVRSRIKSLFALEVKENPAGFDSAKGIERFYQHLYEKAPIAPQPREISFGQFIRSKWFRYVAAAILLLIIALPWASYHITSNQVIGSFAQMEMKAPEGSTLDLYLPDSTNIHLNSGSLISYSQGYNISDRNVALDGEAFFKVKHNKELPFRVLTAEMVVEDIGTEFFIRNYRDENEAVAGLISGKISLRNQLDKSLPVEMSAGDKVIIDKSTGKMKLMKRAVSPSTTCDDIYFENMNLYDVAQILSRSYGVSIKVRDKIKGVGFYGYFNRKEDAVGDIIDAISRSCHIHYKKDKNSYYLY
jgi:ferric-dicitrate binding protein FerR (iron transport regulator)